MSKNLYKGILLLLIMFALSGIAVFLYYSARDSIKPVQTATQLSAEGIVEALVSKDSTSVNGSSQKDCGDVAQNFASTFFQDVIGKYYSTYSLGNSVLPDFEDQVFTIGKAEDLVSAPDSGLMTFTCEGQAAMVLKLFDAEMRERGWVETSSGNSDISTYSRVADGYSWVLLACTDVYDEAQHGWGKPEGLSGGEAGGGAVGGDEAGVSEEGEAKVAVGGETGAGAVGGGEADESKVGGGEAGDSRVLEAGVSDESSEGSTNTQRSNYRTTVFVQVM